MINPWHFLAVFFAAAIAFAASVTYVLVLDADGSSSGTQSSAGWVFPPDRTDCNEIYGTAYRSEREREWFNQNCSLWSKSVGDVPDPPVAAPRSPGAPAGAAVQNQQPATPPPDGRDCNQIRGTAYRSDAERAWFLASCQGQTAQAQAPPPGAGPEPDRTDCNQIRGTPYRSDNERNWYNANCLGQPAQAPPGQVASAGPDRTDCNEIRGTAYRSDNERRWYQANCPAR